MAGTGKRTFCLWHIGLQPSGRLFAVQKLSDDNAAAALPETDIVKKWWAYMADLMDTHPDNSPVSLPLREVFHLD